MTATVTPRPLRPAVPVVAAAAVVGSYLAVRAGVVDGVDRGLERWLTSARHRRGDRFLVVATDLGSSFGLMGVTAALALLGRRTAAVEVGVAGGAAWLLAQGVKPALGRARPYELGTASRLVSPPAGSSWPSGHAAVGAAMATAIITIADRDAAVAAAAGAAAIGASRIAVGVHHLSDVIAGFGVGVLAAAGTSAVTGRLRLRRR
ncbi:MAG: phosphatase PAP2 family protein [Nitriliruptor sp.]|nr:MAG: phosphatase PAP2 family protein [Nitriliruptor sp.]